MLTRLNPSLRQKYGPINKSLFKSSNNFGYSDEGSLNNIEFKTVMFSPGEK